MENYGRIISCGAISGYDNKNEVITNYPLVITKRLTIKGFIYFDYASKTEQAFKFIDENLKLGKLKTHDMVFQGLESAPEALKCLLEGKNTGKVVVSLNQNPKL
jgi:NADPH-dependent curcumin reductase CurA